MPLTCKTSLQDLQIGDYVWCKYTASSGQFGVFSDLATKTDADVGTNTIPATSTATPNGYFKFIKVGTDYRGRDILISNVNVQHSISWDTLNTAGVASGSGLPLPPMNSVTADNNSTLNYSAFRNAQYPVPIVFNNELYITWQEDNSTRYQIQVKKWNGTSWVSADNNSSLNYNTSQNAYNPVPIVFNNELYITWQEYNAYRSQIRVKKWNGISWVSADNNSSLNYNTSQHAYNPVPIVFNNELYITWQEQNGFYQIRVKKWNGTSWVSADNNSPLNYNTYQNAQYPVPIGFNNELYITWYEHNGTNYQIRVKKWNGTSWVSADNNSSLNYNTSQNAQYPVPIVFNNELYITWYEYNGTNYQIRVKKWNGTSWVSADNNIPLNYDISQNAQYPVPIVFNNELYITWQEYSGARPQIRVKKWNGTSWVSADNNSSLNYDISRNAANPVPIVFNNELYITWQEQNASSIDLIRVKRLIKLYNDEQYSLTMRLLTGGVSLSDKDSEWDKYIVNSTLNGNITAGDNNVWNWNGIYSWTSTTATNSSSVRTIRGNPSVGNFTTMPTSNLTNVGGFRPVLIVEVITHPPTFDGAVDRNFIHNEDVTLTGVISDPKNDSVQYRILVNGVQVYPETGFTVLAPPPISINYTISNSKFMLGNNQITVEMVNSKGDVGTWVTSVTLDSQAPAITASMTGNRLDVSIGDPESDSVRFRVLLNGTQVHPSDQTKEFTDLMQPTVLFSKLFRSNEVNIGSDNTVTIIAQDQFGKESTVTLNFIGEYAGLMFADEAGEFYSDDLGNLLKYLDVGVLVAGQVSDTYPIRLINRTGYKVSNIQLWRDNKTLPDGTVVEISETYSPFVPTDLLTFSQVLDYNEEVTFYVRIVTQLTGQPGQGEFDVYVKGDPA